MEKSLLLTRVDVEDNRNSNGTLKRDKNGLSSSVVVNERKVIVNFSNVLYVTPWDFRGEDGKDFVVSHIVFKGNGDIDVLEDVSEIYSMI